MNEDEKEKPSTTSVHEIVSCTSGATTCSSLCLHPWNKKPPPVDDSDELLKNERLLLLRAQILSKKNSVRAYRKLKKYLIKVNSQMQDSIMNTEDDIHRNVTSLLEKYEKCTSASSVMAGKHKEAKKKMEEDFLLSKDVVECEKTELENEVLGLEQQLNVLLCDLQVLRTYKDKEYPVKAMTIAKLQNSSQSLAQEQKAEIAQLQKIIDGERDLMVGTREQRTREVLTFAAEDAFNVSAPTSVQRVATSNAVLKDEIEQNKQEIGRMMQEVLKLEHDVALLRRKEEIGFRRYVFPEVYPNTAKCDPDDDITLDIPKQPMFPL